MHGSSVTIEAPRRDADHACACHCHHSVIHVAVENNRVQRFAYAANHGDGDGGDDDGGGVLRLLLLAWSGGIVACWRLKAQHLHPSAQFHDSVACDPTFAP